MRFAEIFKIELFSKYGQKAGCYINEIYDIMYAKAKVNMVQIPDARACMERTNLLHVSAPASPGKRRFSGHLPERASETLDG